MKYYGEFCRLGETIQAKTKTTTFCWAAITALLIAFSAGCTSVYSHVVGMAPCMILEREYTWNFQAVESSDRSSLEICGMSGHSALAVSKISLKRQQTDLIVLVHLAPGREGIRGDFKYFVPLPPGINRVVYGRSRSEIWNRDSEKS